MPRKPRQAEPPSARQRALGLLTRREHSARELKRKLVAKGHEADEADAVVGELVRANYQSDERFAEAVARQRAAAGYGPRHVAAELRSHGIDPRAALAALDLDWTACAQALVRRRYGRIADREQRVKAAQFLARRGFAADAIRAATSVEADLEDG
jgi:regulatory protein